ncbi:DUF3502 domain-containing protein [Paenibacillus sp. MMO-177]|uniref:DUF3502 domain-containing protein n=1 Tax=Paenibacillus sp. MMO-177 TaxID=3081289 RepID=UPI003018E896
MQRKKSWKSAAMIMMSVISVTLAACSNDSNVAKSETPVASNGPDLSEHVNLTWYLVGDPPKDMDKVLTEFNKMAEKDLNTTLSIKFTSWTDWQTKYNLLLTSGEPIDMIYAANWLDFYKYAKQGAFVDISSLLPTDMPDTWSKVPKDDWKAATIDNKIYAVPNTNPNWAVDGFYYREDWRQELNLPEIKDLDTLGQYMDGVKKAKTGVIPINGNPYDGLLDLFTTSTDFQLLGGYTSPIASKSYMDPRDIVIYPFTPEYADYVKRMKQWADNGYWSKNALIAKQSPGEMITSGTGAINWGNIDKTKGFIEDLAKKKPEMKIGYFNFSQFKGYAMADPTVNNAMAIPRSSKHIDRSLMLLDKIRNNESYFNLITYGIQGTHYDLDTDGKSLVIPPAGVDPKNFVRYDISGWGWYTQQNLKPNKDEWTGYKPLKEKMASISKPNIFDGITMDYEPVKSQLAAVNSVVEQYGMPLMVGAVKDVDAALKTYQDKLKQAGVEALADYIKEQANKHFDEIGIQ